jgi:hypothetical protein
MDPQLARAYLVVTLALSAFFALLAFCVLRAAPGQIDPRALLPAVFAMVSLTAAVWLAMLLARNVSVALGKASVRYYRNYRDEAPPEWIERPARAFMNLLEVPVLFYVACLLMMTMRTCDAAQLALAWIFVATRVAHTVLYIGWNHVPTRFAAYVTGCVTLGVIWTRLASSLL